MTPKRQAARKEKKLRLFRTGTAAIRQYIGTDEYYLCPLCFIGFPECDIDYLTVEHVPPQFIDGREIMLTCHNCNSTAGGTVDGHLHRRAKLHQFRSLALGDETSYDGKVRMTVNGETINVKAYRDADTGMIRIVPQRQWNNPEVYDRVVASQMMEFQLTSGIHYKKRWAEISELRSAYLAAFAKFGYRLICHPTFDFVREQIANPDCKILDRWSASVDPSLPPNRMLFEVQAPHCIAAQLDSTVVFLPIPGRSDDLYKWLGKIDKRLFHCESVGWPTTMELLHDIAVTSPLPFPKLKVDTT